MLVKKDLNKKREYLYRISDYLEASGGFDETGEWRSYGKPKVKTRTEKYEIITHTRCGAWVRYGFDKKFINLQAHKQYACETEEKAWESYLRRKQRQVLLLSNQLENARKALQLAEHHMENKK